MNRIAKHILAPAVAPALVVGLYLTPVATMGCVNRGIAALGVVFVSLVAGMVAAVRALLTRARPDAESAWWALSAFILALPALLVLGPLG